MSGSQLAATAVRSLARPTQPILRVHVLPRPTTLGPAPALWSPLAGRCARLQRNTSFPFCPSSSGTLASFFVYLFFFFFFFLTLIRLPFPSIFFLFAVDAAHDSRDLADVAVAASASAASAASAAAAA